MERRGSAQLVISVSAILSVIVASVSLISFVQSAERRITTMEVKLDYLSELIKAVDDRREKDTLRIPQKK